MDLLLFQRAQNAGIDALKDMEKIMKKEKFECSYKNNFKLPQRLYRTLIWDTNFPYLYMRTTDDNRFLIGGECPTFRMSLLRGNGITYLVQAMKIIPQMIRGKETKLGYYYRFGR